MTRVFPLFLLGSALLALCSTPASAADVVIKASPASAPANHPATSVSIASGRDLLGGGARANWTGNGSMLYGTRPTAGHDGWQASAKDHVYPDEATITAFALQLDDPDDAYEVKVVTSQGSASGDPSARASLPSGWVMTGGGCHVEWSAPAAGNLLTGSYPDESDKRSWICDAEEHLASSSARITAYVIGIKPRSPFLPTPTMTITKKTSNEENHPTVKVTAASRGVVTGGGARTSARLSLEVEPVGPAQSSGRPLSGTQQVAPKTVAPGLENGLFLTASFPTGTPNEPADGWEARAKDHGKATLGTVTAYSISVDFGPACACKKTGAFTAPTLGTIADEGPIGSFDHPEQGSYTIASQLVGSQTHLTVKLGNTTVKSFADVAAWAPSPDGRFFAVVHPPVGTNAGAPITVHRIGTNTFTQLLSTEVWPDGKWGFSKDGSVFVVTRLENTNPGSRFSADAHNLLASNPALAKQHIEESNAFQHAITFSPCGDRMMHFRWTQLSPHQGAAEIHARKDFGNASTTVHAQWDGVSTATPTAKVELLLGAYVVRLDGLTQNGQSTIAGRQCEAPSSRRGRGG